MLDKYLSINLAQKNHLNRIKSFYRQLNIWKVHKKLKHNCYIHCMWLKTSIVSITHVTKHVLCYIQQILEMAKIIDKYFEDNHFDSKNICIPAYSVYSVRTCVRSCVRLDQFFMFHTYSVYKISAWSCSQKRASPHSSIGKSAILVISTLWVRFPGWPTKNY